MKRHPLCIRIPELPNPDLRMQEIATGLCIVMTADPWLDDKIRKALAKGYENLYRPERMMVIYHTKEKIDAGIHFDVAQRGPVFLTAEIGTLPELI